MRIIYLFTFSNMRIHLIILTSLIILSSCSIDWNDDKDKYITELKSENNQLMQQVLELRTTVGSKMQDEEKIAEKEAELKSCIEKVTATFNNWLKQYNLRNNLPEDYPPLWPPWQVMIDSREKWNSACIAFYK